MKITKFAVFASIFGLASCDATKFASSGKPKGNDKDNVTAAPPAASTDTSNTDKANDQNPTEVNKDSNNNEIPKDGFKKPEETKTPKFGLLVNDVECSLCHVTINGDISSTKDVVNWSEEHAARAGFYKEIANGFWRGAGAIRFSTAQGTAIAITVKGKMERYLGPEIPKDPTNRQVAKFPTVDWGTITKRMSGSLEANNIQGSYAKLVDKVYNGNVIALGTAAKPIKISGDVFINGDLVVKGFYTGLGTIYVRGRVYIPANLRAKNAVFPYPADQDAALAKAKTLVQNKTGDALAIASGASIFVADLDTTIYDRQDVPPDRNRAALKIEELYKWFPGGKAGYNNLYELGEDCKTGAIADPKSFNVIDGFLYAETAIAGISRGGSWAVNGGMLTNIMHLLGRPAFVVNDPNAACSTQVNKAHGFPNNRNYINYDYRLKAGLQLLGELAPYFDATP